EPGKDYEYTIPLGNAGTILRKGHRIRLEISSSSFPHYARNLNTGKNSNWTSEMEVATQTILHSSRHPSRLVLGVGRAVRAPSRGQRWGWNPRNSTPWLSTPPVSRHPRPG